MSFKAICIALIALVFTALACASSGKPSLKLLGGAICGLLALASTAATIFCISVGIDNNWTSDGPGMLIIMIGVLVFGIAALLSWGVTASVIFDR